MIKSLLLAVYVAIVSIAIINPVWADEDAMTEGVVKKIDTENSKITIKHGPIVNLDMPPMSMVFTVKDKAMIESFAKGDKVKFVVIDENGKLYITEIVAEQ